jgi:hypothetical protein
MVHDEIRALIAAQQPAETAAFLRQVDATLTDGYAHALQLETERGRIERRIEEIIAQLPADTDTALAHELVSLLRRRTLTDKQIAALRTLLSLLRERRTAVCDAT